MPVTSWSTTPALNTLDSGTAGSGGTVTLDGTVQKPSEVDNVQRSFMAQLADFRAAATFTGTTTVATLVVSTTANPDANDGATLGQSGTAWSDLFLASGAVINFNAGNYTIVHTAGTLTLNGVVVFTASTESAGKVRARVAGGSSFEWGHTSSGYIAEAGSQNAGQPYISFHASKGTTANTWKTWSTTKGSYYMSDNGSGGHIWGTVPLAGTDDQAASTIMSLTTAGVLTLTSSLVLAAGTAPTAEGAVQWNTTTNAILVGDAAATKTFRANSWETISETAISAAASFAATGLSAFRKLRITGFVRPATDGTFLLLQTDTNNGASYDAGASDYSWQNLAANATTVGASEDTANTGISISGATAIGNATEEGISFTVCIEQFNQTTYMWLTGTATFMRDTGIIYTGTITGQRLQATARDAIRLIFNTGNISIGHVVLEGVRG